MSQAEATKPDTSGDLVRWGDLISTSEAASLMGCDRRTVERRINSGGLRGRMVAGTWLTLRSEVVELVRERAMADIERVAAVSELSPTLVELRS